jgi:hypothetical protein
MAFMGCLHISGNKTNKLIFLHGKTPMWGNIHGPSQCGHLRKFINAKEKYFTRDFLTIDHQKMTLHAF